MGSVHDTPLGPNDQAGLFRAVSQAFTEWTRQPDMIAGSSVKYSIRGFIRRYLRRTSFRAFANTVDVSRQTSDCDLTIGNTVGIKIIHNLYEGSKDGIHKQLRAVLQEYEYLIVYGHQISVQYTDTWRQIKRSLNRYAVDPTHCHTAVTINDGYYRIPATNISVTKTVIRKYGIYCLFVAFVFFGSHILEGANDGNVMGEAFIWTVIVFNISILLMAFFLVRNL